MNGLGRGGGTHYKMRHQVTHLVLRQHSLLHDKAITIPTTAIRDARVDTVLLNITISGQGKKTAVTTLHGEVIDQAALAGILGSLYDLHLPLLSVEYIED